MKRFLMFLAAALLLAVGAAGMARADAKADQAAATAGSSMIKDIRYDAAAETLTVTMVKDNAVYEYRRVPEKIYKDFVAAKSKGTYFLLHIKGQYEFVKK